MMRNGTQFLKYTSSENLMLFVGVTCFQSNEADVETGWYHHDHLETRWSPGYYQRWNYWARNHFAYMKMAFDRGCYYWQWNMHSLIDQMWRWLPVETETYMDGTTLKTWMWLPVEAAIDR